MENTQFKYKIVSTFTKFILNLMDSIKLYIFFLLLTNIKDQTKD